MILIDYHFLRDTRERQNLVINYESESKTSRFEYLMHHLADEWCSVFELRSLLCALQWIVEWLSKMRHSFRSCESTHRRRAMWISNRRDLSSHLMSWKSFAESNSNQFRVISQRWLHILDEAIRDIVLSFRLNDESQQKRCWFWYSYSLRTVSILERWIAYSHLMWSNRAIRDMCQFSRRAADLIHVEQWYLLIICRLESELSHSLHAESIYWHQI
jgi:hypothetical protein